MFVGCNSLFSDLPPRRTANCSFGSIYNTRNAGVPQAFSLGPMDDLTEILARWPYEPGKMHVRKIEGKNGNSVLQVRLGLGILQMAMDGRPDGERPDGFESLLEALESGLDDEPAGPDPDPAGEASEEDSGGGLQLGPEQCMQLREEASQYHQRYVAFLAVHEFSRAVRDTTRNLRALDLIRGHAVRERDRRMLEPQRPGIIAIRARALAGLALKENQHPAALFAIDDALEMLRGYYESLGRPEKFESAHEPTALRMIRESLQPHMPTSQRDELERRLKEAISQENYRLAAILRDEIELLDGSTG